MFVATGILEEDRLSGAPMKTLLARLVATFLLLVTTSLPAGGTPPPSEWQLLVYSLRLLPIEAAPATPTYDRSLAYRLELVQACVDATTDRSERYICVKVARFESNYREDVGRCEIIGKARDKTPWQIVPRNAAEDARLCLSLVDDARFHLERVRESRAACRHLPKQEQLALYARGDCGSEEGRKLSRHRFPTDAEVQRLETERW